MRAILKNQQTSIFILVYRYSLDIIVYYGNKFKDKDCFKPNIYLVVSLREICIFFADKYQYEFLRVFFFFFCTTNLMGKGAW